MYVAGQVYPVNEISTAYCNEMKMNVAYKSMLVYNYYLK